MYSGLNTENVEQSLAKMKACATGYSPHVMESNNVLDSGFHVVDSGFQVLDPNFASETWILGPVVRRPISANPGLYLNARVFFFSSKAFSRRIFSSLFRLANHQIVDEKN